MRIQKQLYFQYFTIFLLCYSYICRTFLSKVPGLILFGAMKGNYYGDNSRHLYEWIISNRPDLKPVWLTINKEVFESLKNQKKPVLLQYSMKAIRLLSQVQVATFTNSLKDLAIDSRLVPNSIKLVALRHGRSVKRVRFARLNHKISHNETLVRKYEGRLIKYAISTSDFISDLQEKSKVILFASRVSTVLISLISLVIAYNNSNSIYDLVLYAWSGMGSAFGPTIILALYSKKINECTINKRITKAIWKEKFNS